MRRIWLRLLCFALRHERPAFTPVCRRCGIAAYKGWGWVILPPEEDSGADMLHVACYAVMDEDYVDELRQADEDWAKAFP